MLLSPSRADSIIFELEGVLIAPPFSEQPEETAAQPLYAGRWDKLSLPVGIVTSLKPDQATECLKLLGWDDLPRDRLVCLDASHAANGFDSLCRSLGSRCPLLLLSSPAVQELAQGFSRGDLVGIGKNSSLSPYRFPSAADALRAILGVV